MSLPLTLLLTSTTLSVSFNGVRCCCCLDILLPGWLVGWGTADKTIHRNYGCCFLLCPQAKNVYVLKLKAGHDSRGGPFNCLSISLLSSDTRFKNISRVLLLVSRAVLCQSALLSFAYDTDKKTNARDRWSPVNPVWDLRCWCNPSFFSSSNLKRQEDTTEGAGHDAGAIYHNITTATGRAAYRRAPMMLMHTCTRTVKLWLVSKVM